MVSVIIPNYNHSLYLKERIDSILSQTYQDIEIIIMDDLSLDDSKVIIETYRDHPKVVDIIYNQENSGSTFKQWNKGVSLAKGEYILFAESDDISAPTLIQTLVNNIEKEDNISISYCQSYGIDSKGNIVGDWLSHTDRFEVELFRSDFVLDGVDFIKRLLIHENSIPNASAVLFRREIYLKVGGSDPNIKYCSDWNCWLKLLSVGKIAYSAQKLNYFRRHPTSVIASMSTEVPNKYKFDIAMRESFNVFLSSQKTNTTNELFKLNRQFIRKHLFGEAKFLLRRGYVLQSLSNLFKIGKYF